MAETKRMLLSLPFFLVLFTFCACGAGQVVQAVGEENVVEVSRKEKPIWLSQPFCPKGAVCARGSRTRAAALEHARTDAHYDAVKDFARRLESKAKALFSSARDEGRIPELGESPEIDNAIKEFFAAASRLRIQNVKEEDFWWKKVKSFGEDQRIHYYFDYEILLSIPETTWRAKVKELIDRQKNKARGLKHEALVKELDRFAKDLDVDE